jgi:GrpB-like predicted nucleotidyltransferase (UPF0157 family)
MAHRGDIGLHRGTVKLVEHSPNWSECFREERELLLRILGEKVVDVRHIGSTSIPGMAAKPIIDILAAVQALTDVETFVDDLNKFGYEDKGDGGVPGRRFFVKGVAANRTHHLNFCETNSEFWTSHVAFCDYLVRHPATAQEYSLLKRKLADQFPIDRSAYTAGKEQFVRLVLDRAANEIKSRSRR